MRRALAALLAAVTLCCIPRPARTAAVHSDFLYGAAFFYERMPRTQWAGALQRYRDLGINTIDLYVMWNWHEVSDGHFDFTGKTNPRRDLSGLLALIHRDGLRIVLRPGPVIRNEWRNGGYPAWLLTRPAYRMPLRDVLEGRYPATATLQNAHSNAAAREWLNNATHLRYATRWLQHVYAVAAPYRDDIVAVALDDDQGAYLDNDTWPAPDFHRYVAYLASVAHRALGARVPVFINTFEMKVTASAPAWAWGNWYQSDAYRIGEHDRAQLEFSTGLLQTQRPGLPVMISEFQAGWLQGADEARPRAADPSNTTLALHTLLQMGAHGVVNFPVQDTLNPAGWEAPWTNAFYSWDAAYSVSLSRQARFAPTAAFGRLIARYGDSLARTQPAQDAAVAYLTSAYDPAQLDTAAVAQIAQATIAAQRGCRVMRITCGLVDLRYASARELRRFAVLIVPPNGTRATMLASVRAKLTAYRNAGGRIERSARLARVADPAAGGIPNAVLLVDANRTFGFLDIVNYGTAPQSVPAARVHADAFAVTVPPLSVPPRDAVLLPLGEVPGLQPPATTSAQTTQSAPGPLPLRAGSEIPALLRPVPANQAVAYRADVFQDGYPAVVLENAAIRLIVSPCAGARALVFEDKRSGRNVFTTIGGLRDAWTPALPASPRDYIAKYTHPIATGTFNRCYTVLHMHGGASASVTLSSTAPDAPGGNATFERTIRMPAAGATFQVSGTSRFAATAERAMQLSSIAGGPGITECRSHNGVTFFDGARRRALAIDWSQTQAVSLEPTPGAALLTLTFPGASWSVRYRLLAAGGTGERCYGTSLKNVP